MEGNKLYVQVYCKETGAVTYYGFDHCHNRILTAQNAPD